MTEIIKYYYIITGTMKNKYLYKVLKKCKYKICLKLKKN